MKMIDERIATLTAEKERIMTDYPKEDDEIQTMLGMENMRISMELKFLNELNIVLVSGRSELLIDFAHHLKNVMCSGKTWSIEEAVESFKSN